MAGFVRTLARDGPFQFARTVKVKTEICNLSFDSGIQFMCSAKTICYRTGETDIYMYARQLLFFRFVSLSDAHWSTGQLEDAIFTKPQLQLQL